MILKYEDILQIGSPKEVDPEVVLNTPFEYGQRLQEVI